MSNHKVFDAKLSGWNGPIFPEDLEKLQRLYGACNDGEEPVNWVLLQEIGQQIPGCITHMRPETSDGYDWFFAFDIKIEGGRIIVALPWCQDWTRRDGTKTDRSIAIYYSGWKEFDCSKSVQLIVAKLREALTPAHA